VIFPVQGEDLADRLGAQGDIERREAQWLAAQVELDGQRRALAQARIEAQQRAHAFRHQAADLAELRSRSQRLHEALQTAQGWRSLDLQKIIELESHSEELLRQNGASAPGVPTSVSAKETALASTPVADPDALDEMDALRDAAWAATVVYDEQQWQIVQLQAEVVRLQARIVELEAQRRSNVAPPRAAIDALVPGKTVLPSRVLVRIENGQEVFRYTLGRRTTIGRMPDNDIQIETTYASKHHALVLSNSRGCLVEDLSSTNGVLVNGRRVGRQSLCDGDSLLIGNIAFTFQQSE
jgi:hypothetical protein